MTTKSLNQTLGGLSMRTELPSLMLGGGLVWMALLSTKMPDPAARSVQATAAILALGLVIHRSRTDDSARAVGWEWIVTGLALVAAGSLAGALESLSFFRLASGEVATRLPHWLERVFGLPVGLALLAYGLYRWMPSLLESKHAVETYLDRTLRSMEELREELRQARREAEANAQRVAELQGLERERDLVERLMADVSYPVAILNQSGHVERINQAFIDLTCASAISAARIADLVPSAELSRALHRVSGGGRSESIEVPLIAAGEPEPVIVDFRLTAGVAGSVLVTAQDVGRRRALERREHAVAEQAAQLGRLAALAELVGGAAHELNNPISVISGYVELLELTPEGDERGEMLREIERAASRCKHIVNNLQMFVARRPSERQCIDVNQVLLDVLSLRDYHFRERRITVAKELASLPSTVADPHALQQAFFEIVNAAYLRLRDSRIPRRLEVRSRIEQGNIEIEIADNAEPRLEYPEHDPIRTSSPKLVAQALDDAAELVRAHGGDVSLVTAPSGGTTCEVALPIVALPVHLVAASERERA